MEKTVNYAIIGITTTISGYIPVLFGQSAFGLWSVIMGTIGGFAGVYIIYQMNS